MCIRDRDLLAPHRPTPIVLIAYIRCGDERFWLLLTFCWLFSPLDYRQRNCFYGLLYDSSHAQVMLVVFGNKNVPVRRSRTGAYRHEDTTYCNAAYIDMMPFYLAHSYRIQHWTYYKQSVCLYVTMCVCLSVCLFVCLPHFHSRISWSIFAKSGTEVTTPKSKMKFVHRTTLPLFCPQKPPFWKSMQT